MKIKPNHYITKVKNVYSFLIQVLEFWYHRIKILKLNIKDFKYRLTHLKESNLELGIYHLEMQNFNDAIMRFKLIDKFFEPNSSEANYWLGWCYYLKGDMNKAIIVLKKAKTKSAVELQGFIENIGLVSKIPDFVWINQRELTYYIANFKNPIYSREYAINFVKILIQSINELPDSYNILELGYNNSYTAEEIKRRMPPEVTLSVVEPSEILNEDLSDYYSNYYDNIILESITEFFNNNTKCFDIIYSCCGISYIKNLDEIYSQIYNSLKQNGYFALVWLTSNKNQPVLSLEKKEFTYNPLILRELFEKYNFTIVYSSKLPLGINDNYFIMVGQK